MKIALIGAGTWGIALARLLVKNNHSVKIWVHEPVLKNELENKRELSNLPGVKIPSEIDFSCDYSEVLNNADIVLVAVASPFVRKCMNEMKQYITENMIVTCVAKGIEKETLFTMSEIIEDELKSANLENVKVVALSGPTHAEEVSIDMPTTIVSASKDLKAACTIQDVFMNENFRVYTNNDIKAVEICGAFKNIYALACGVSKGLGYGDNLKAAIMTRGIAEMVRLGTAMNCKKDTFYGLAGIGDLIVTATSEHSRNNRCGQYIGQGLSVQDSIDKVGMVVEGINCIPAAIKLMKELKIDMPIAEGMNEIINNGKNPREILNKLMVRDKKSE